MLINLLPHRDWALARQRQAWAVSIGLAALAGVLMALGASAWQGRQLTVQQAANSRLQQAIKGVDEQIKHMALTQAELEQLSLRETTLRGVRDESPLAGFLLQELAAHLPDGLYLTAVQQEGDKVRITGIARSGEEVFELLRQMVTAGQWLVRPELIEVAAAPAAKSRPGAPVGTPFAVRAFLQRPELTAAADIQLQLSALD
jgi:type IV pilus assembly protein PilN